MPLIVSLFVPICIQSQEFQGTSGLLHVPSAEMESVGTFRGWGYFLGSHFNPFTSEGEPYSTFCYGIGITPFKWIEVSFVQTLVKEPKYGDHGPIGYYNQDRHFNVKFNPLYEGRWWPAIAVGWDDVGNFRIGKSLTSNNNFENIYIALTKHLGFRHFDIGAHLIYRYYPSERNREHKGVAGGITFAPRFGESLQVACVWLQRPRFIVEWDGVGVNIGADVLIFKHLVMQACLAHGRGFTGGLSYHYTIRF